MGLTIKTPVKDIGGGRPVIEVVEEKLKSDRSNAYTIAGLMIQCFGAKEEDLNQPFRDWEEGQPALYSRIRKALDMLTEQGKIKQAKKGKAMHYWYVAWREREVTRNR